MSEPFIGEIRLFGFNFAPAGWAECNGQLLQIAQNNALFALLGTTYGGDGQTTFALPDLRGRNAIHQGNGPGLSNRSMGERAGTETVTLTTSEMPAHAHQLFATAENANDIKPQGNQLAGGLSYHTALSDATLAPSIGMTGGNQAHPNMPPFLTMNYCIALVGIFPSQ